MRRQPRHLTPRQPLGLPRLSRPAAALLVPVLAAGLAATGVPPVGSPANAQETGAQESEAHATGAQETGAQQSGARVAPTKIAVDRGRGGAVASVDPYATRIGLKVLEDGGNAVDAAVATAAALGVSEPFSAGIGGGGYFMHLDGSTGRVLTIDGRESAPRRAPRDLFIDPATGDPYPFYPDLVTSGLAVGTPGTVATWQEALKRWGSQGLRTLLRPAADLAREGFVVDETFAAQVEQNADRFAQISSTAALFLPEGRPPAVGSTFRNPGLARTYEQLARRGARAFYRGRLARNIVATVARPPALDGELPVPPGYLRERDLADYAVRVRPPLSVDHRGLTVHGMGSSSSGGSTVGEALKILGHLPMASYTDERVQHAVLEASALAFADRAAYVGDRAFVSVPDRVLLDPEYAAERLCAFDLDRAAPKPLGAGQVKSYDGRCEEQPATRAVEAEDHENTETTHLVVADKWGDVVSYTLTIEQTGGAGIVVPGRGFLLNNELTDFSLIWKRRDPNRIEPGKRPRSSMAPTIVTDGREPVLALGSPGGSTIITTVLSLLVDIIDRNEPLTDAIAAPRATQRNTTFVDAEPAWISRWSSSMSDFEHLVREVAAPGAEIGAVTGIEFGPWGEMTAVAESERRGGGDARVVDRR